MFSVSNPASNAKYRSPGPSILDLSGFSLPGSGESLATCGELLAVHCDNVSAHSEGFNRPPGTAFVKIFRGRCMRSVCPVCYEAWAHREGDRASHRIESYKPEKLRKPVHVIISPPAWATPTSYRKMRTTVYGLAKEVGLDGGLAIFHHLRTKTMQEGPHFHMLAYGWVSPGAVAAIHEKTGWIIKNKGVRRSAKSTISYLLSHAAISESRHTVTWWGALSYNKLKVPKYERPPSCCPMCERDLKPLYDWEEHFKDPPNATGSYCVTDTGISNEF